MIASRITHRWGATGHEHRQRLPGEELVQDPAIVATRAVTIEASAAQVWRRLIQIGQDHGGMYSYDGIENLLGLRIHSATRVHEEWQHLAIGDRVILVRPGWAGLVSGYSLPVAVVDPPRALVLRQSPPEHPWDAVWSFHLRDLQGEGRCRLISRGRARRRRGASGLLDVALDAVMDPVAFVMTRKMRHGIRRRAEAAADAALHTTPPTIAERVSLVTIT